MEFYEQCQIQQVAPLITLSLHESNATSHLKCHLRKSDIANCVWDNSILKNRLSSAKYILEFCDEETARARIETRPKEDGAHSLISPFNVESDLFPNGILSEQWFLKYTRDVPFAFVQTHLLDDDPTTDEALGLALAAKRQEYASFGVKYVAVLLSDGDPIADQDRVDKLRLVSGLPRLTGIFYLNADPETLERDCGILASSIFSNLKASAADFYSGVEARIKQRYKKYYTMPSFDNVDTKISLTPKFLEVRNMIKQAVILQFIHPHNIESSFTMLETSYERLIELTADHADAFFSPSASAHDAKLYAHFRRLLDTIAIHLIRGYLSTEEPTAALRKHEAHIANVLDLCKDQCKEENMAWVAVQYQWIGELMSMVPQSVLSDLNLDHQVKQKAYQNSLAYFGGSNFHDSFNSTIVTQSFLMYLKAFSKLENAIPDKIQLPYITSLANAVKFSRHKLHLLQRSQECLINATQHGTIHSSLKGFFMYIEWLLAEELFSMGQYEEAEKHYITVLNHEGTEKWSSLFQLLTQRLSMIYEKTDKYEQQLESIVRLASQKTPIRDSASVPITLKRSVDIALDEKSQFFSVAVNLFSETLKKEFFEFDTIVSQIEIEPIFQASKLEGLIEDSKADLKITKIEVNFDGRSVILTHEDRNEKVCQVRLDGTSEYKADLLKLGKGGVLQLFHEVTKPGKYKVESIALYSTLSVRSGEHTVNFKRSELHSFLSVARPVTSFTALLKTEQNSFKRHVIRTHGHQAIECVVQPYKPEVRVELLEPLQFIIMGEKFEMPMNIRFLRPPHEKANISSLSILVKSRLLEGEVEQDYVIPHTNWKSLKDDENLSILDEFKNAKESLQGTLQISLRRPPSVKPKQEITFVIEMQLIVGESNKSTSVYDLDTIEIPVLAKPFDYEYDVKTRFRDDSSLDMRNPFILSTDQADAERNFSMPSPSRVWASTARVIDTHKLIESNNIRVKKCSFLIRSKNTEVDVKPSGSTEENALEYSQTFITSSRHRFSLRSASVIISSVFIWSRGESELENEFETDDWEVSLSLQDPRVILHRVEANDGKAFLEYVIENPTPRIFTFTTTLKTEDSALRGVDWNFEDPSNIYPLHQAAFPVLPFSRHNMAYTGKFQVEDATSTSIELPNLQVYDLNYKVSLPTLPVDDKVVVEGDVLYLKQ
ncbi:hypothetical protein ACI3LY_000025 [Candidozyma auris]|uniref:Trafficking protein particle complex subunit 11 domain-containing protein n=2 Tax=Candidozyma auris TaxID=498019 RepID=A0A2H1A6M2_CANAR|nr:hypothetical protein QG37_03070 [[Candida] auris]PIS58530.1 hypothetical protein B9J08_001030 [[Candida] auris]QWW23759.1 hypothetical protein CA7LBN_002560 [[Candida] auris]